LILDGSNPINTTGSQNKKVGPANKVGNGDATENPGLTAIIYPEINITGDNPELEQRVAERASQLESANRHLQTELAATQAKEARRDQEQHYQATLTQITLGLMKRQDTAELLKLIVARAGELVGTSFGFLYLLDAGETSLELKIHLRYIEDLTIYAQKVTKGKGLAGKVWEYERPVMINNYNQWSERLANPVYNELYAIIGLPLKTNSQFMGVLGLAHLEEAKSFSQADFELLSRFAELASLALDNARLFSSTQLEIAERKVIETALRESKQRQSELLKAAQRQAQEQQLINQVRNAIARELHLPSILHTIVEAIKETFNYELVSLYLFASDTNKTELIMQHQVGYSNPIHRMPTERGIMGQVARTGQVALLEDVTANPLFIAATAGIVSEVCVPLVVQNQTVGVFNVETTGGIRLTEADLHLMEVLAEHINMAIERGRLYTEVQQREQQYHSVFNSLKEVVFQTDEQGRWTFLNPAWTEITGYKLNESLGVCFLDYIHPDDRQYNAELFTPLLERQEEFCRHEVRWITKDGSWRWIQFYAHLTLDQEDGVAGISGTLDDITERKLAEEKLRHYVLHDALTGLANRTLFMDRLDHAITRNKRRQGSTFAVLFMDLDRFKVINDSLGHVTGDQLLIAIAHRLTNCLRSEDTVARFGGDEFTILLEDISGPEEATQIADRIQDEISQPFDLNGQKVFTSTSIGITMNETGAERPQDLLRNADTALYKAKADGKARYALFDLGMHESAVKLQQLETDLRKALEKDEFQVYYQPFISLENDRVLGFEALIRWQHPERGMVLPADFIPVAEETGLIVPIGWKMLHESCRQMREWQLLNPESGGMMISVNLSSRQFLQPDLLDQIKAALADTGLSPHSLTLEITESVLMENAEIITTNLFELREMGIRLALDDFGTGYSSLSYLHRFPVNSLKIDRSFIARINQKGENTELVRTIITMAHNLGIEVTAEGVETSEQLKQLRFLKCEAAQGYLIAHPAAPASAGNWLNAHFIEL
jgi:diguanylate cyclase (GGDEF)-like protein/PAS domain S-box-containing protein